MVNIINLDIANDGRARASRRALIEYSNLDFSMSQLITCPECSKHLQVPENLLGKKVQCPECKHTFNAVLPETEVAPVSSKPLPPPVESKAPAWDKKKRDDDEDDDDGRSERHRKRRDDDDDDRDDLPRRRRAPRYAPHRGGLILAFGIIGLVAFGPLGIVAWIMGNNDMREIRDGRMDPEGESMTSVGRILGMIASILMIVGVLGGCGFVGCLFFIGAMGAANAPGPQRRR